ncbi:MAG: DegT/DnrJ/EryC1/StrS family aminotransferase [Candidatus Diapherotrites archaeon]
MGQNKFIPMAKPDLSGNERKYVEQCMESGWIGFSEAKDSFIAKFEKAFADYCGAKYGITTFNGTCSLSLILQVLGIGKGDEIIVPNTTFAATASVALYAGAKPVLADVDARHWGISIEEVKKKISPKTKAVMPVHLYGHPCEMDELNALAEKHNFFVIEDAAQSHGAEFKGKRTGALGTCSSFSFYGNKLITTGEGGIVLSNDKEFYEKAQIIRNQGQSPQRHYWHETLGNNYRMSNIQAAIGLAQLERIEKFLKKKRQIAKSYIDSLQGAKGLSFQQEMPWAKSSHWMFNVVFEKGFHKTKEQAIKQLEANAIDYRNVFYPMHSMPPYREQGSFPVSETLSSKGLTLPSNIFLSDEDIERVCSVILKK